MTKSPTFAIAVTFRIKPPFIDQFQHRVLQQSRDSLSLEPGCRQFDVLVAEEDPTIVFLYETYEDTAAFDIHRTTPHFADFNATIAEWVESKEIRRLNMIQS